LQIPDPKACRGQTHFRGLQGVLCPEEEIAVLLRQGQQHFIIHPGPVHAVFEDIFDKGHQQHRRNEKVSFVFLQERYLYAMPDAYFFQCDIVLEKLDLCGKGHLFFRALVDKVSHDVRETADEKGSPGRFPEGLIIDVVQGIEKEMRLDLGFQKIEFCQAFLFLHLSGLLFEGKIGQCDPEHKAEDEDDDAADRNIDHCTDREGILFLHREEPIVDQLAQKGLADTGESQEENGG